MEETIVCYECKKLGHFKSECRDLEKAKRKIAPHRHDKKKVLMSTWEDLDTSEEKEKETMCLMAECVEYTSYESDEEVDFSYLHPIMNFFPILPNYLTHKQLQKQNKKL